MGDHHLRGMGEMQSPGSVTAASACLEHQEMLPRNMNHHPNMPQQHHQDMQQGGSGGTSHHPHQNDMHQQDLDQDIGGGEIEAAEMHHRHQHHQDRGGAGMGVHEYYASQVRKDC